MGAWGHKPFDNDSAADWAIELEDGDLEHLRRTLERNASVDADDYLDSDDGFEAVAAAELVAAALDGVLADVPETERGWLRSVASRVTKADAVLATRALRRVAAPNSELPGLWSDGGTSEWHAHTQQLLARLADFTD